MSHFTYVKTNFQNLVYLEKALNKLNFVNLKQQHVKNSSFGIDLVIPQQNGYDISFVWNGQTYEFVTDLSFWEQSQSVEAFIDKISQQYACELVIGESQRLGFQPVNNEQNIDRSISLILERWNSK